MTQAQDSIQKEEKNKSLCKSSLNAHERGRLHVRHIEPSEAVLCNPFLFLPKRPSTEKGILNTVQSGRYFVTPCDGKHLV